jgi:hypothetical protein
VEEVCSLFLIYSVLDKTRHEQFEDMLAKKQKRLEELEEEVKLAKDEVVVATRKFEKVGVGHLLHTKCLHHTALTVTHH